MNITIFIEEETGVGGRALDMLTVTLREDGAPFRITDGSERNEITFNADAIGSPLDTVYYMLDHWVQYRRNEQADGTWIGAT
jgi:hypothetical protein